MSAPSLAVQVQGQGTVTADNLNTFEQTCDNAANLRAFIGAPGVQVYMRGFADPNDGGQGEFYWNASGSGPDDGGITNIVPTGAASGCWTRIGGSSQSFSPPVNVISTNTTVALSDAYTPYVATADLTMTLTRTTLLNSYFWVDIDAEGGSVILSPNANDSINVNGIVWPPGTQFVISEGASCRLYTDAVGNWYVKFLGPRLNIASTIASSATTDLGSAATNLINVTGANTITSLGTSAGVGNPIYFVRFADVLILTYNSTSLILPSEQNITTAAGDIAIFEYLGSGNWKCWIYQPLTGQQVGGAVQGTNHLLSITVSSNTQISISHSGVMLADATGTGNTYFAKTNSLTNSTATSGAGGLDTGSIAANTWYAVHLIYNPTTNTNSTVICLASGNPTMPSGYVYRARIGAVRTDGSSNLKRTVQYENVAQYVIGTNPTDIPSMASGTASAWTAVATGAYVPPTAHRIRVAIFADSAATSTTYVVPNNSYNTSPSATHMIPLGVATSTSGSAIFTQGLITLESSNIYWSSGNANNGIGCIGWEDAL